MTQQLQISMQNGAGVNDIPVTFPETAPPDLLAGHRKLVVASAVQCFSALTGDGPMAMAPPTSSCTNPSYDAKGPACIIKPQQWIPLLFGLGGVTRRVQAAMLLQTPGQTATAHSWVRAVIHNLNSYGLAFKAHQQ
jgi:hypothetical protein